MKFSLGTNFVGALSMLCLVVISETAIADAVAKTTAADSDSQWGVNLQTERQHQEFNDSSADITTISLLPYLQLGNWDFSVDLPWQRAEGGYFVNHFQSAPKYYCQYDPVNIKNKRKQARLIKAQLANCGAVATSPPDSVEGWSDATVFAHYGIPLDERGIWLLSVGGGYKFDNGDVDKNLGSGTRDTLFEASLSANYGLFSSTATGGYALVAAGETTDTRANYYYGDVDIALHPLHWLSVGATWSYDQSYYTDGQDVQEVTGYIGLRPLDKVGVRFYVADYLGADGYPNREYGGSVSLFF